MAKNNILYELRGRKPIKTDNDNAKKKPGWARHISQYVKKKKGESNMDAFLKMIDDLQTPKHKTNHIKYRRCFPQYVIR